MFNFLLFGRSVELDLLDAVSSQPAITRKTPALFQPLLQTRSYWSDETCQPQLVYIEEAIASLQITLYDRSRLKTRLLVGIVITRSNEEWELGVLLHLGKELLMNKTNQIRKWLLIFVIYSLRRSKWWIMIWSGFYFSFVRAA